MVKTISIRINDALWRLFKEKARHEGKRLDVAVNDTFTKAVRVYRKELDIKADPNCERCNGTGFYGVNGHGWDCPCKEPK